MTGIMPPCNLAPVATRLGNMSLSRDTIEQLLSGYMDEALSNDERAQVEELLRSNPDVAGELEALRRQRESLQAIARVDRSVRLDAGFADRVLDAAVQRGRAEGLSEDHPVIRLAEQPSAPSRARSDSRSRAIRVASIVAALAASIALAVTMLKPETPGEEDIRSIANLQTDTKTIDPAPSEMETAVAANEANESSSSLNTTEGMEEQNSIVQDALTIAANDSVDKRQTPSIETLAANEKTSGENTDSPGSREPGPQNVARERTAQPMSPRIAAAPQRQVGAVMVLEIAQTESGRMSRAVRNALKASAIEIQNEKLTADDIVGVLGNGDQDDESLGSASILYLEGSAKQLDRFILTLCSDQQGIDSVRFGLASELPILNLLRQLKRPIDPKTVRHSASWSVQAGSQEASRLLTGALVDRTMAPLDASVASLGMIGGSKTDGPDVMSELFVVVR